MGECKKEISLRKSVLRAENVCKTEYDHKNFEPTIRGWEFNFVLSRIGSLSSEYIVLIKTIYFIY